MNINVRDVSEVDAAIRQTRKQSEEMARAWALAGQECRPPRKWELYQAVERARARVDNELMQQLQKEKPV